MAGAPSPPRPGRAELDTEREVPKWSPESALRNAAPARWALLWTAQGAGPRPDPPLRPRHREAAPLRPPHLADRTRAPFPQASAPPGR